MRRFPALLFVLGVSILSACGDGITLAEDAQIEDTATTTVTTVADSTVTSPTVADGDDAATTTTTSDPGEDSPDGKREPVKDPERVPTNEVPPDLLAVIVADAAQRAGVGTADAVVSMARVVEWPDASLGCPQPGMSYAQVVTPGYQVQVSAGGAIHDYRADASGSFFVCEQAMSVNDGDLPGDERIDPPPPES